MGKFSQPRNRFQEPVNGTPKPPVMPASPQDPHRNEEEAIEQAFQEVSESSALAAFVARNKTTLLIGACASVLVIVLAVVGILLLGKTTDPYDGMILDNVMIAGVNVGGLTRSQAEKVIQSATDGTFTRTDMVIQFPEGQLRLSPEDTGAKLDVKAAVKAAYDYGRTGSQAQKEAAYQNSLTREHTIALLPYLDLDTKFIRKAIESYAAGLESSGTASSWRLEGEMPDLTIPEEGENQEACQTLLVTLGIPGTSIDTEALYDTVLDAYSFNLFQVMYAPSGSEAPSAPDLQAIYDELYIAPVDASTDAQTYAPIPGSYGYDFDLSAAEAMVAAAAPGETVSIPMRFVAPGILEDELMFQDILGYCETPHNQNENRNHNLKLVCELLNGLILEPGEAFSYNDSVGERTAERGFKAAPAYSGTRLVDSIGGGVCQGSSTLYYAALVADMEIIFRINHGFPVNYIPYGLDATVNWGGPDLEFRNSSNYPVQIRAEVSDGLMKMWIMGTDERDYYVKLSYLITSIIEPEEEVEEHGPESGYTDGQVLKAGTRGYIVRSFKHKYSKVTGEEISKDFIALSSYMTENKIVVKLIGGEDEEDPTEPEESTEPSTGESTEAATEATTEATTPPSSEAATQPSTEATDDPGP